MLRMQFIRSKNLSLSFPSSSTAVTVLTAPDA
jgi:hypothetical protein